MASLFPFSPDALEDLNAGIIALVFNLIVLRVVTLLKGARDVFLARMVELGVPVEHFETGRIQDPAVRATSGAHGQV